MKKISIYLFVLLISSIYPQCNENNQLQCIDDDDCEWFEDVSYGNCSNLAWQVCESYIGCYVDSNPGWYDNSGPYCSGGTYPIDDSYCLEIEMPECSDMDQLDCSDENSCDWIENIESGSCGSLSDSNCELTPGCDWEYGCIQMGWWYNWCYTYGYECNGGTYSYDIGYCEETEFNFGDINQDNIVNIQDVVLVINLILDQEFDLSADINLDSTVNVLDIIQMVNIILNN